MGDYMSRSKYLCLCSRLVDVNVLGQCIMPGDERERAEVFLNIFLINFISNCIVLYCIHTYTTLMLHY